MRKTMGNFLQIFKISLNFSAAGGKWLTKQFLPKLTASHFPDRKSEVRHMIMSHVNLTPV